MDEATQEVAVVALRRPGSESEIARGVLLDRRTAYLVGEVDGLDDPAGFEVVVLPPQGGAVERIAPERAEVVHLSVESGVRGFTLVRLADATRFRTPPPRRWDPVELVLAIEDRAAAADGPWSAPTAQTLDGADTARRASACDPVADTFLPAPVVPLPEELLAQLPADDDPSGVPEVTHTDVGSVAAVVPVLCLWIPWCEEGPPSEAELVEAVAERRRTPPP